MHSYAKVRKEHRKNPTAMMLIIGVHAGAIAALLVAKMEIPIVERMTPIEVENIELPKPPKPETPAEPRTSNSQIDTTIPLVDDLVDPPLTIDVPNVPTPNVGPIVGPSLDPPVLPAIDPPIVKTGPRLATAADALRPPYPESKLASGEGATIKLRLFIDTQGRVIQVEPVGRVDRDFFRSAKRHILKAWRYQPAMEGERAVASSTTVTITFELTG